MERTTMIFKCDNELKKKFKSIAAKNGETIQDAMHIAMQLYVEKFE